MIPVTIRLLGSWALLAAVGMAQRPALPASELHDPQGYPVAFELRTLPTSVQIYTCNGTAWTGPDPDAIVANADRSVIFHHYKGPTWESTDGSLVKGGNAKHYLAPVAKSVDWLELTASGGTGRLARITLIHRIDTSGGVAPSQVCDASHNGELVRVPYSATYRFYER